MSFYVKISQTFILAINMGNLKNKFLSAAEKLVVATSMMFGVGVNGMSATPTNTINDDVKQRTELSIQNQKDDSKTINYSKVKIRSYEDLEKMFDMAMPIIFNTLMLEYGIKEEVINSERNEFNPEIGTGFQHIPESIDMYDNSTTVWLSTNKDNKDKISYTTLKENDFIKLIIGWGKNRTQTQNTSDGLVKKHKTILRRMYENIKGAELRPNELAAIYCAIFFNENNLRNICLYVQDHYNNTLKCANMLISTTNGYTPYSDPTKIALLNGLVFLNTNNFCEAMLYMPFDNNSKKTCLEVVELAPKTLTDKNYKSYSDKCKKELLGCFFYPTNREIPQNIVSRISKNLLPYRLSPDVASPDQNQRDFEVAITHMNAKSYNEAMNIFTRLEKTSSTNAVLLEQMTKCYYEMGQYDNAIKYGQKILNSFNKTERAEAAYYVGKSYMGKNQPDQATIFFKKAIDAVDYLPPKTRKLYVIVYRGALDDAIQAQNEILQQQKESRQQIRQ